MSIRCEKIEGYVHRAPGGPRRWRHAREMITRVKIVAQPGRRALRVPGFVMVFTRRLREAFDAAGSDAASASGGGSTSGVGGRYRQDEGHIVVDSVASIRWRTSPMIWPGVGLLGAGRPDTDCQIGGGSNVYLIRFHYTSAPGAWASARAKRGR